MEPAHLVCFRIGKETFGVDISSVREIVRGQEITKVPGTPECALGVVNLRGRILSVVDLGHRLGLTPSVVSGGSRILVTHLDGLTVGFLVDTATEVMKLPAEAIEPPPTFTDAVAVEYIEGVGKPRRRTHHHLEPNPSAFDEPDRRCGGGSRQSPVCHPGVMKLHLSDQSSSCSRALSTRSAVSSSATARGASFLCGLGSGCKRGT